MVITENYKRSFSEVNTILKSIPDEMDKKIPNDLKNIIEEERLDSYNPELHQLIVDKNIMPESVVLLGLIYRDFLSPEDLRRSLQIQDDIEYKEFQVLQEKKYSNMFKNRNIDEDVNNIYENIKETSVDKYKEKWYKRFLNLFKFWNWKK